MRMRDIISEAPPSDDVKATRYYHGTKTEAAASKIMTDGIQPGSITQGRGKLDPVAGKVYVTPSIEHACIYALGGVGMGHTMPDGWIGKSGRYGFVFVVNGADLTDIQPDEDSVGAWFADHTTNDWDSSTKPWRRKPHVFKPDGTEDARKAQVWHNIRWAMTDRQFQGSIDGEMASQSAAGKRALKKLSEQDKMDLIRWGAHIAHTGPIMPIECWRIDKTRSKEIAKDASNFFEIAEKVSGPNEGPISPNKGPDIQERAVTLPSGTGVIVIENPTTTRLLSFLQNSKTGQLRGLADGNNLYWWDAYEATHGDIAAALGLGPEYVDGRLHLRSGRDGAQFTWVDDEWKKFPFHPLVRRYMTSDKILFDAGSQGILTGPEFLQSLKDDGLA